MRAAAGHTARGVHFEVHGTGAPLFLGFPMMASYAAVFGSAAAATQRGFLDRLADRYRVLTVDYPSIGGSATIPPHELTIDRVCDDMLAVADAAGFDGFAWWGGTFGAVTGLALAARSERVSALVCAGWSPLGIPYSDMVRAAADQLHDPPPHARVVLREPSQYAQWPTFYGSLGPDWERRTVARIDCPRAVIYGEHAESSVGRCPLPLAATIRGCRAELEQLGWSVIELPGADAGVILDPAVLVTAARRFLDSVFDTPASPPGGFR
ncbi:MAG: alpha/beta fold hydrolase [Pseudomonadota bacterium]